ncbi:ABC transporter permease [Candidatus Bathyarchaeota archaeon]|nr:ABC transporter permease [Candidatus Bathyarchaeota archaeon]
MSHAKLGVSLGLRGYLVKRVINTIILILFVIIINFVIFELLPGPNGAIINLTGRAHGTPQAIRNLQESLGLCQSFVQTPDGGYRCIPPSIWSKFVIYFQNMLTFQFGQSQQTGNPVLSDMMSTGRLWNTLELLGTATAISLIIGILLGVVVAARRGTLFDSSMVTVSLTTFSLPTFFMGIMLIFIFSLWLGWFPSGGVTPQTWVLGTPPLLTQIVTRLQYLFLPALTLTLFFYGGNLLLTRATMGEALTEDYITTARAKGLPERTVLFKHALKNASLPIVTNAALAFGGILGGAIITETVFVWDGLGLWLFRAITWHDFPVLQAMFYIIALCVIGANLVSDIVYGMIDPRIKYE